MNDSFISAFPPRATNFQIPSAAPAPAPVFSSSVLDQLSGAVSSAIHSIVDQSLAPERERSRLLLDNLSYKIPFYSAPRVLSFSERFPVLMCFQGFINISRSRVV